MANLMSNTQYKYDELSNKYGEFRVPTFVITIDGNKLSSDASLMVTELTVDLSSEHEAGGCVFEVTGAFDIAARNFKSSTMASFFQVGKNVSVDLGYIKTENVFRGYISAVTIKIGEEEPPAIRVECTDVKGLMMNNHTTEQRTEEKMGDVVSAILKNAAYKNFYASATVDAITSPKRKIEVAGESDYDFLVRLASRINYEFFLCQGNLYFRKPKPLKKPVIVLEFGNNLLSFERRMSLEGQVLELEVRSSDIATAKVVSGIATSSVKLSSGASANKALKKLKKVVVDASVATESEAKDRAAVLLERLNDKRLDVRIGCIGIPEIVPGRFIKVDKLGTDAAGTYYITRVTHTINEAAFRTMIEARA